MTITRGNTARIINNKTTNISQVPISDPSFPYICSYGSQDKLLLLFDTIPKQKRLTLYFIQHIWPNYLRHEKSLVMS